MFVVVHCTGGHCALGQACACFAYIFANTRCDQCVAIIKAVEVVAHALVDASSFLNSLLLIIYSHYT